MYSTVDRELERQVKETPNEVMFTSYAENKIKTFSEFNLDVNKLSKHLIQKFHIQKGDSIGLFSYNCYNWLVVQYACSRVGAILTPINPSYKPHELAFILKKGQVKVLFAPGPKSIQSQLNNHMEILQSDEIVNNLQDLHIKNVVLMDGENEYDSKSEKLFNHFRLPNCELHTWQETEQNDGIIYRSLIEAEEATGCHDNIDTTKVCIIDPDITQPDDLFAVYYTSGTTGTPKGACVSHFTVINNVRFCQLRLRHGRPRSWRMILATCLPLFHIFAGVLVAVSPVLGNTHVIFSGHKYDIGAFVDCIRNTQSKFVCVTPTILIDMLSHIEKSNIKDMPLRMVQCGGAALPPEVAQRAYKILTNLEELRLGYGSTENGAVATLQSIHEPQQIRTHSVGPPLDFTELRIVRPGTNTIVKHYENGDIQTRGFNTMVGYLGQPDKTAQVLGASRWYKTGDSGFMHPHGSIQISGRSKQLIIKGGENIYPEEVRDMIIKLPYIDDVHVIGVPDKRFGEQVCAWVKLKPGFNAIDKLEDRKSDKDIHKDDIIEYCKKNITYFKVPKYLLFVDDFPMTPTKKPQAHMMTEQSIEILGLQDQISSGTGAL